MTVAVEVQNVTEVITTYFDAIYYGDADAFERIMHPSIQLYCATDGELVNMDLLAYLKLVRGRPSPASRKDQRYDRILALDLASPTTAHVRVQDAYLPKKFTDELTLVKIEGRWWIVSKVWHYDF